jgi:ubiquinol-cytochrome c reductase cytochrome b subunit
MLRAVPAYFQTQIWGVIVMFGAVIMLFFVPWLDRSPVKSVRYRGPLFKIALVLFAVSFSALTWLGMQPTTDLYTLLARLGTFIYYAFFLAMPWYTTVDRTRPVPERVTYGH